MDVERVPTQSDPSPFECFALRSVTFLHKNLHNIFGDTSENDYSRKTLNTGVNLNNQDRRRHAPLISLVFFESLLRPDLSRGLKHDGS